MCPPRPNTLQDSQTCPRPPIVPPTEKKPLTVHLNWEFSIDPHAMISSYQWPISKNIYDCKKYFTSDPLQCYCQHILTQWYDAAAPWVNKNYCGDDDIVGRAHHMATTWPPYSHAPWLWLSHPYGHPPALALALPTIWPKPWLKGPVSKNPTIQFHKFLSLDWRNAAPIQIILSLRHPNSHGAAYPQYVPTLTCLLFQASAARTEQEMTIWRWTDVRGGGGKKRTATCNWASEKDSDCPEIIVLPVASSGCRNSCCSIWSIRPAFGEYCRLQKIQTEFTDLSSISQWKYRNRINKLSTFYHWSRITYHTDLSMRRYIMWFE